MRKTFLLTVVLAIFLLAGGCRNENREPGVSVTIEPLKYFVDRLTSEKVEVNVMVPMGASPQTYSPTSGQLGKVSSSALYVRVGELGFEQVWMERIKGFNEEMKVLNLSENIDLLSGENHTHGDHVHEGGKDPHIWMSPDVVKTVLPEMKEALIESFPEHRETIEQNYESLYEEVDSMDQRFSEMVAGLDEKKFMIFHPALSYLARDYGLEQISIEYEGKEPSPRKLRELIDVANEENIRIIFIQAEFDQRNAEMVREATDAEIATINPLAYKWPESMEQVFRLIKEHLREG
ncbi:MAG: zinc ABC transporter substrate-binding protein [Marinilabilia sp.]